MSHSEEQWLVKSSGVVSGPYTTDILKYKLSEKQYVALDEVSLPFDRWRYIRDIALFALVLEEVRLRVDDGGTENTFTYTHAASSSEESGTMNVDESHSEDFVVEAQEETLSKQFTDNQTLNKDSYVYGQDKKIGDRVKKSQRKYWLVATILIAIAVGAALSLQLLYRPFIHQSEMQALFKQGIYQFNHADYKLALNTFNQIDRSSTSFTKHKKYLPVLFLTTDKNLESETGFVNNQTVLYSEQESMVLQAYRYMLQGEYRGAENILKKVLSMNPHFLWAKINLGITYYLLRDYAKAKIFFYNLIEAEQMSSEILLMYIKSTLKYKNYNLQRKEVMQLKELIKQAKIHNDKYVQEIAFYDVYLNYIAGLDEESDQSIVSFFNLDPWSDESYSTNLFVFDKVFDWDYLLPEIKNLSSNTNGNIYVQGLYAFILSKAGKVEQADKLSRKLIAQKPANSFLQSIRSIILLNGNMQIESSVSVGKALQNRVDKFLLPYYIQASICRSQKDMKCARENYTNLLSADSANMNALVGIASIYYESRNFTEAGNKLTEAQRYSSNYLPLYQLRYKIKENKL